jgi:hypothetical protein
MVIGHLALDGAMGERDGPQVARRQKSLYLEKSDKPGIMVVNITKAQKAIFLIKDVDLPKDDRVDSLQMIGMGWR